MSRELDLQEVLLRVRAEASSARAFFCTWNALNLSQGDKKFLHTMNHYRNVDFFLVSMEGSFRLFFLSLGNIFDKRKGTMSLRLSQKRLHKTNRTDLKHEIEKICAEHRSTIEKIRKVRNELFAHMDKVSMEKVFEDAAITPNQVEALIDAVCDVLNKILAAYNYPDRIAEEQRYGNAVQFLLENLHRGRLNIDEHG